MHVKAVSQLFGSLKLIWERIMFSRFSVAYFVFTIIHFIIQVSFQIRAFSINASAANLIGDIVSQGENLNKSLPSLPFLNGDQLRLCSWLPSDLNVDIDSCPVVWDGSGRGGQGGTQGSTDTARRPTQTVTVVVRPTAAAFNNAAAALPDEEDEYDSDTDSEFDEDSDNEYDFGDDDHLTVSPASITVVRVHAPYRRQLDPKPQLALLVEGGEVKVNISGLGYDSLPETVSMSCIWSLNYPANILYNTKREDIVFVAFQVWVGGMSIIALLNESIPHIIASLLTHVMATAWAAFQISHTANFRANFNRVITQGACGGATLLPNYWKQRAEAEIPSLALNGFSLVISAFLTWKLIKLYGWQTFKRVGASILMNRIYKLVLTLSILIQLSLFFMVVTVSLWLDQLLNSVIGDQILFLTLYKVASIVTLILLLPWFFAGWFGLRKELRLPMFIFLFLSVLYLGAWSVMFFSTTFRWTFITWRFFSVMASVSVFLTISCLAMGVLCRFNFGKGLIRYLDAQETLSGDDYAPHPYTMQSSASSPNDVEKVAFPSNEKPIPTFSTAFGPGAEVPPPAQMHMGPRFFSQSSPFDSTTSTTYSQWPSSGPHITSTISSPPAAVANLNRQESGSSTHSQHSQYSQSGSVGGYSISRMDSRGSSKSEAPSYYSYHRTGDNNNGPSPTQYSMGGAKRLVIE